MPRRPEHTRERRGGVAGRELASGFATLKRGVPARLRHERQAERGQHLPADHVDQVVLPGRERRDAHEHEPRRERPPHPPPRQERDEHAPQQRPQRDVQRRAQVVRPVEGVQRAEQGGVDVRREPVGDDGRPRAGVGQGDEQEAQPGEADRQRDPSAVARQVRPVAAGEERRDEQQVERPVRHDRPRQERDEPLDAHLQRRHGRAERGQPVGQVVDREEPRPPPPPPTRGRAGRRRGKGRGWWERASAWRRQSYTRRAAETVKMPQRSIRCVTFSKPAAATRRSISPWGRRRITHAAPSRLVSTRAIISTCGCHG